MEFPEREEILVREWKRQERWAFRLAFIMLALGGVSLLAVFGWVPLNALSLTIKNGPGGPIALNMQFTAITFLCGVGIALCFGIAVHSFRRGYGLQDRITRWFDTEYYTSGLEHKDREARFRLVEHGPREEFETEAKPDLSRQLLLFPAEHDKRRSERPRA